MSMSNNDDKDEKLIIDLGSEFIKKAVSAKYQALDSSLYHVSLSLSFYGAADSLIVQTEQWEAPGDYYSAGLRLSRQLEGFLRRYNRVLSPADAKEADAYLKKLMNRLERLKTQGEDQGDFKISFEFMAPEARQKAISTLPFAKLKRYLRQWQVSHAQAVLLEADVTLKETPQAVKRAASFYISGRTDKKPSTSLNPIWSPR